MFLILVSCIGSAAIDLDRTGGHPDDSRGVDALDSGEDLDTGDSGEDLDTGDSGEDLDSDDGCADAPPLVTGIALACDGPALAAWWSLAGGAADVRVTWSADGSSYAKTWSAGELDGPSCCGSATADTWRGCDALDGVTVLVEALDDDGARLACSQVGADPSGACPPVEPPVCE